MLLCVTANVTDVHPRQLKEAVETDVHPRQLKEAVETAISAYARRQLHGADEPRQLWTQTSGVCGSATTCVTSATSASAYTTRALTYNTGTGIFTGTITTNQCPHLAKEMTFAGALKTTMIPALTCGVQSFPVVTTTPAAASLRGAIGYTIRGGMSVYGPMDAGFSPTVGFGICSAPAASQGYCPAGTDVEMCLALLQNNCGTSNAAVGGFASMCGNHASPSHYHTLQNCDYDATSSATHSTLLSVVMDGRGLYGKWEGAGLLPVLDACGGHYGPVPAVSLPTNANEYGDTSYPGSTGNVYHYHVSDEAPFFVGCYGPVSSLIQAKALYATCAAGAAAGTTAGKIYSACTSRGYTSYQLDCPVYRHAYADGSVETYNQIAPTSTCPGCGLNCPFPAVPASATATTSAVAASVPTTSAASTPSAMTTATASNSAQSTATAVAVVSPSATMTAVASDGIVPTTSAAGTVTAANTAAATATATGSAIATPSAKATTSAASTATTSAASTATASAASTATSTGTAATLPVAIIVKGTLVFVRVAPDMFTNISNLAVIAAAIKESLRSAAACTVRITGAVSGGTTLFSGRRLQQAVTITFDATVTSAADAAAVTSSISAPAFGSAVVAFVQSAGGAVLSAAFTSASASATVADPGTPVASGGSSSSGGAIGGGIAAALVLSLGFAFYMFARRRRTDAKRKLVSSPAVSGTSGGTAV